MLVGVPEPHNSSLLMDLLDGRGGKNWHQRSKALEHFRRTVGAEAGTGVNLHVTQQMAVVNADRPRSFEEAIDMVRRRRAQDEREQDAIPESIETSAIGED